MSEEPKDDAVQYPEPVNQANAVSWFKEFFQQFQLAWQLTFDQRVPFVNKLIPMATLAYLLLPVDFVPDIALGLGQMDDLAILLIGLRLFIEVCPPELVDEFKGALYKPVTDASWTPSQNSGSVIDVEAEIPFDNK